MVRIKDPQPNVVRSLQWWVAAQECVQFVQKDEKIYTSNKHDNMTVIIHQLQCVLLFLCQQIHQKNVVIWGQWLSG